jgi:hypothetical protein
MIDVKDMMWGRDVCGSLSLEGQWMNEMEMV